MAVWFKCTPDLIRLDESVALAHHEGPDVEENRDANDDNKPGPPYEGEPE